MFSFQILPGEVTRNPPTTFPGVEVFLQINKSVLAQFEDIFSVPGYKITPYTQPVLGSFN
jgi:hypothetical protein